MCIYIYILYTIFLTLYMHYIICTLYILYIHNIIYIYIYILNHAESCFQPCDSSHSKAEPFEPLRSNCCFKSTTLLFWALDSRISQDFIGFYEILYNFLGFQNELDLIQTKSPCFNASCYDPMMLAMENPPF